MRAVKLLLTILPDYFHFKEKLKTDNHAHFRQF